MKTMLFHFGNLSSTDPGVKKAVAQFKRAGSEVVQTDAMTGLKRSSGVSYRELYLTFADSQRVVLRIKQTGDIFQVLLNNALLPIKAQDDHVAAIAEIAAAMDKGRTQFQRRLAAAKVKLPAGIRTAAPRMEQVLTQKRDDLKAAIAETREQTEALRAAADTSASRPAWQLPMGAWIAQEIANGPYSAKYAADATARAAREAQLQLDWMAALTARASEGRISDASLDDLIARVGEGALRSFRGVREPGIAGYLPPDLRAQAAMDSATQGDAAKGAFMAFNVDSFNKYTVYVKVEAGMSDKDARADAYTAATAEMGKGSTRLLPGGKRVKKTPEDAWESSKARGWAWFAKGHLGGAST